MKKNLIAGAAFLLLAAIFIWMPYRASDLHIRIQFDEGAAGDCQLYYGTDTSGGFAADQYVTASIEDNTVDFCLDGSLAGHLTQLRIDFPAAEQLLCIRRITVSSAGVVKLDYSPCDFFSEENMAYQNGIAGISSLPFRTITYISTESSDPYILLSDRLSQDIAGAFSHYRLTRLGICIFLVILAVSARRSRFTEHLLSAAPNRS